MRFHRRSIALFFIGSAACTEVGRPPMEYRTPNPIQPHDPSQSAPAPTTEGPSTNDAASSGGEDAATSAAPDATSIPDAGAPDFGMPTNDNTSGLPCTVDMMLTRRCRSCHGATPSSGAPVSLMTYDDLVRPSVASPQVDEAEACLARIQDTMRPMPPSPAPGATMDEIAALRRWILSGMPFISTNDCTPGDLDGGAPSPDATTWPSDTGAIHPDASAGGLDAIAYPPDSGSGGIVCRPCHTNADCNFGTTGNLCLRESTGISACGTLCVTNADCPSGEVCYQITDSNNQVIGNNCYPASGTCGASGQDAGTTTPDAGNAQCPDTWLSYAGAFFNNDCAGCHAAYSTQAGVAQDAVNIQSAIDSRTMPRGFTLSSTDIARIDRWFSCGMP